ncbi:isocitrate lyase/PEP mutase family protein [Bordetella avium]|uniref:Carboxyvinyl-carboxyphosphonate phosphorylmutase n=1 Tax=Bordetella avium (strain 197N) TaxID=360910 RepID=Q2KVK8_BORA1|nr:isocitrate lyase/PEP mutase family protein [Bordetella avium]AZY48465.1 carboxyvinyl-carboxyphosphonate phosphorylmutase [Bordetella avium]RIQ17155.1 carboxyvinyl-carboxyphosphonate phosphorylmutase [Bordetella avium]RIQ36119.1 carboxyvinyl-carboxyphosphonate phosphorylmutase [Bordetella avium]RIQ54849.1 carboxyvinyl-carboxyphosphonate phosphorylmutase [Bordetella avium]RIQ70656.1 carboxyvinyl-carboxyphosphonate phosphorylmutase [Bordetella avium]
MQKQNLQAQLAGGAVLAPGVYDALSALIAEQAGFGALYLSGASIAYTRLGRSDIGLTTYSEVEDTLARITERVATPVIVDADTGFGNALNTQRTVRGLERAGAAMIQLEDQTSPKRCGHLDGKSVIPAAEMRGKLRAAADARVHASTLILARTDALAVEGLEAALDRAESYLEAGADALFIEALRTPEQMQAACSRFAHRAPLLANMVEGGKTPVQNADALAALGFRIVIFPGGTARAVAHTLQGYYASLRQHGTTAPWRESMLDFDGLNAVIGTPELLERGRRYEG